MEQPVEPMLMIVGIGNEFRSDDGLGPCVVRELRKNVPRGVRIKEHSGEGTGLMDLWKGQSGVIVIDAIKSGSPPGTIHSIDPLHQETPRWLAQSSSHTFGVAEAIALSRHLGTLPGFLRIVGIEAESFAAGQGLSTSVVKSVPSLLELLRKEITRFMQPLHA